ncbi:MAG TPA: glycosyltransferase family 1 protein [Burkholderiales bacterium]|nr:glycosyltransferase family 1 protein [Burkholderiales bacterium]
MKVAYDPQIFSAQVYGGVSRYFCEIASRIAREPGVQVSITAPMHVNAYLERVPQGLVSGFRAPRADCLRMPVRGLSMLIGDWMIRAQAPNIVHETYFFPYRLGPRRARRVLTIYDMIHERFASNFPRAEKVARYKALAAGRADHVICISESTRRDAIEILGLRPEKTSVIYLGFEIANSGRESTREPVLPTNEPFLLFVGNRGGHKNFLGLLEAYATSPRLRAGYGLICFGGGAFSRDEIEATHKLGLDGGRVKQLGGDDQVLASLYERASAYVYPSLYEGFGIPPLEAMSYDCPVVCSKTSSIPEVVGDAGEYFEPRDIESMRLAIENVLGSNGHRELLIAKGRERLKCFSWDRCATETLDVYRKLA